MKSGIGNQTTSILSSDKKNYLKKLSTIVRIEDHLEMKKLNYTKEYFSVIKNVLNY